MKRKPIKVLFEVDGEVLDQLDRIATERVQSRSQVIELACRQFVGRTKFETSSEDDEKYAASYRDLPEEPAVGNVAFLAHLLAGDEW
jgi:metal-responsive CopG/Arc/MetJ family transcriptional regulator